MQLLVGTAMLYIAYSAPRLMEDVSTRNSGCATKLTHSFQPANHVNELTFVFTSLVFLSATQGLFPDLASDWTI